MATASSRPKAILRIALDAAVQATLDSGEDRTSVKDLGLLNEQWVQSYVGDAISRHLQAVYGPEKTQPFVTYETNAAWIDYFAAERSSGPYAKGLGDKSRFDLTVWGRNRTIEGLIEIKDQPVMETYSRARDPKKIMAALRKWPNLKWGLFLFSVRATDHYDDEKMDLHLNNKISKVEGAVSDLDKRFKFTFERQDMKARSTKCVVWCGVIVRRKDDFY